MNKNKSDIVNKKPTKTETLVTFGCFFQRLEESRSAAHPVTHNIVSVTPFCFAHHVSK